MFNVPYLNAVTFLKRLESGRTKPSVFLCENQGGEEAVEYVVKLKGSNELGVNSLLFELYASLLANHLGLSVPEPAIISIQSEYFDFIENDTIRALIGKSEGNNFGSNFISGGYTIWPTNKEVPPELLDISLQIFVFDLAIQNPDRRVDNPNILWKGQNLYLIDHETGFSFVRDILPQKPWEIENLQFYRKHIFYQSLRHKDHNYDWIKENISKIDASVLNTIEAVIPDEWKTESTEKIKSHFLELNQHIDEFILSLRRVLV